MAALDLIDTIVIVMMENRSFDHMLGHLRLPHYGGRKEVEGLTSLKKRAYANVYDGEVYYPTRLLADDFLPHDIPHERKEIARQLATSKATGGPTMSGFVEAYFEFAKADRTDKPEVMGFFTPELIPVTSFLAREFAICDQWFAPLPASTQPNRLVALSGYTEIAVTRSALLPEQHDVVLDWLCAKSIPWRVYSAGISFFALMRSKWDDLLGDNFRRLPTLAHDVLREPSETFPKVIIVEPDYHDSPVHFGVDPNDNHPPIPVAFGEEFLLQVYLALSRNAERWKKTLLIVTYDEHGGFFDHVPPPAFRTDPPPGRHYEPFQTLGVRVPAIVVSPLVSRGSCSHALLDHTSILQLLAEKYAGGATNYSAAVTQRREQGIRSLSEVLDRPGLRRTAVPRPPPAPICATVAVSSVKHAKLPNEVAFERACKELAEERVEEVGKRLPEVSHWHATRGATKRK